MSMRPGKHGRSVTGLATDAADHPKRSEKGAAPWAPQNTTPSPAWLRHASSAGSSSHSPKLSSVPLHFTFFAATGGPLAPHTLPPP